MANSNEKGDMRLDEARRAVIAMRSEADRIDALISSSVIMLITGFGFSNRATKALRLSGIDTVPELVSLTSLEVLRLPNIGHLSLDDIEKTLAQHGLTLRAEAPLIIECQTCGAPLVKDHQSRLFCSACRKNSPGKRGEGSPNAA